MTDVRWQLDIERIVVTGAGTALDPDGLRGLVEQALTERLGDAALPINRSMKAFVRVQAPMISGAREATLARAVAAAVVQAVSPGAGSASGAGSAPGAERGGWLRG